MQRRLQLCVTKSATPCDGGCNPVWRRLQPYVTEAATLCDGGCHLMMVLSGMPEKVPVAARWRRMPG